MTYQNSTSDKRREQSRFPVLGKPGVLNYSPNDGPEKGNFLHGQPCFSGRPQDYTPRSRQHGPQVQRQHSHNTLVKQVSSPLPLQTSHKWRSEQSDRNQPGRRKQRLSYSRWHMMISSRYKTELCRQFSEDGDCPFDDKCLFAHGQEEIRPLPRHPKYKTELCRDFHQDGFCSFGPRCNFVHTATDVEKISANLRQKSKFSTADSGNESCDDQSGSGSSVSSTPTPDQSEDGETFFHFPEGLYHEITGVSPESSPKSNT